jgi:hypothetical protein
MYVLIIVSVTQKGSDEDYTYLSKNDLVRTNIS